MKKFELNIRIKMYILRYRAVIAAGILILLFCISAWFVATRPNQKVISAAENMLELAHEIRRYHHNRPDYWGLSTQVVILKKIAPANLIFENKLFSPLSAELNVGSGADGAMIMPGTKSFDIAYKNLSKKDCEELASYPLSEESKLGLLSIIIKNIDSEIIFTWGGENRLPISREKASLFCQSSSAVIWNFE